MIKNKTLEKLMRWLITLLGAGAGTALCALFVPLFMRWRPDTSLVSVIVSYAVVCAVFAAVFYLCSSFIIRHTMRLIAALERGWENMSTQQILFTACGLVLGGFIGNFAERLIFGYVRDMIFFPCLPWFVCNVADICICFGVAALAFSLLFRPQDWQEKER